MEDFTIYVSTCLRNIIRIPSLFFYIWHLMTNGVPMWREHCLSEAQMLPSCLFVTQQKLNLKRCILVVVARIIPYCNLYILLKPVLQGNKANLLDTRKIRRWKSMSHIFFYVSYESYWWKMKAYKCHFTYYVNVLWILFHGLCMLIVS